VAKELLRRGWAPKDFKHVRPALEHLVAIEVLDEGEEARKEGEVALQEGEEVRRKDSDGVELPVGRRTAKQSHRSLIPSPSSSVL
jgi:hypothetical protein